LRSPRRPRWRACRRWYRCDVFGMCLGRRWWRWSRRLGLLRRWPSDRRRHGPGLTTQLLHEPANLFGIGPPRLAPRR